MGTDERTLELIALRDLIAQLRAPNGCPWDREQGLRDLRGYMLEEAHEVAGAIDGGDWAELRGELGDLLFQVCYIAHLAQEEQRFTLDDIAKEVHDKMVARHPHVFAEAAANNRAAVEKLWHEQKRKEESPTQPLLSGIPTSLPALLTAYRMGQKAAGAGFDWKDTRGVLEKIDEELAELAETIEQDQGHSRIGEELGDLLLTVASLGRHLGIDPEAALAAANLKFRRRFGELEHRLARQGLELRSMTALELETLWEAVKENELREVARRQSPTNEGAPEDTAARSEP